MVVCCRSTVTEEHLAVAETAKGEALTAAKVAAAVSEKTTLVSQQQAEVTLARVNKVTTTRLHMVHHIDMTRHRSPQEFHPRQTACVVACFGERDARACTFFHHLVNAAEVNNFVPLNTKHAIGSYSGESLIVSQGFATVSGYALHVKNLSLHDNAGACLAIFP